MSTTTTRRGRTYRRALTTVAICLFLAVAPIAGATAVTSTTTGDRGVSSDTTLANEAPQADAGYFRTFATNVTVELNASRSSDPDGDDLSYTWRQVGGPSVTLEDANTATPTFETPSVETSEALEFEVTVDDGTTTDTDTVKLAVEPGAEVPTVNAGLSDTVVEETAYELNGERSHDPNGDPLSYEWTQTSGPNVSLEDADTPTPSFVSPDVTEETTLEFELRVTDPDGNAASETVSITVDPGPEAPIAKAGDDRSVGSGETVTLDASESFDYDGDPLTFSWSQVSGPSVDLTSADTATAEFTAPQVSGSKTLAFAVTVTDDDGIESTERVEITVEGSDGGGEESGLGSRSLSAASVKAGGSVVATVSTTFQKGADRARIRDGYSGPIDEVKISSITLDGEPISSSKVILRQAGADDLGVVFRNIPAGSTLKLNYEVTVNETATNGSTVEFTGVDGSDVTTNNDTGELGTDTITVGTTGDSGDDDKGPVSRRVSPDEVTPGGTLRVSLEATVDRLQAGLSIRDAYSGPVSSPTVTGVTLNGTEIPSSKVLVTLTDEASLELALKNVPPNGTVGINYTVEVDDSASEGDRIQFVGRTGSPDVKGRTFEGDFADDTVTVTKDVGVTERFDRNDNQEIDDPELQAGIQAWVEGSVTGEELQTLIAAWVESG